MLRHFIIEIPLYHRICQVVAYERFKTKYNFKLLALKVVAVALTRGDDRPQEVPDIDSDLT